MAESGKVEAAIERLRQMRESTDRSAMPDYRGVRRPTESTAHAAHAAPQRFAAQPTTMMDLPVIDYDPQACNRHHILLPDGVGAANPAAVSAYRHLRTRVLHRSRANDWSLLGVTSPGPGQGKTVTSINLAMAIARERNNNVFLLDLDLRNPGVCRYLGVQPPHELREYFAGRVDLRDTLFSIGLDNLTIAGGLRGIDTSSELLATGRAEQLFSYIREVAPQPMIIVDMPPVLTNDDALVLAPKVDATLIVVSQGISRRDAVQQTMELFQEFNLAGVVMNRAKSLISDYYGG
jgi:protein-tyrosine kinase